MSQNVPISQVLGNIVGGIALAAEAGQGGNPFSSLMTRQHLLSDPNFRASIEPGSFGAGTMFVPSRMHQAYQPSMANAPTDFGGGDMTVGQRFPGYPFNQQGPGQEVIPSGPPSRVLDLPPLAPVQQLAQTQAGVLNEYYQTPAGQAALIAAKNKAARIPYSMEQLGPMLSQAHRQYPGAAIRFNPYGEPSAMTIPGVDPSFGATIPGQPSLPSMALPMSGLDPVTGQMIGEPRLAAGWAPGQPPTTAPPSAVGPLAGGYGMPPAVPNPGRKQSVTTTKDYLGRETTRVADVELTAAEKQYQQKLDAQEAAFNRLGALLQPVVPGGTAPVDMLAGGTIASYALGLPGAGKVQEFTLGAKARQGGSEGRAAQSLLSIQGIRAQVARATSEVGNLAEWEQRNIVDSFLPSTTDTPASAREKIQIAMDTFLPAIKAARARNEAGARAIINQGLSKLGAAPIASSLQEAQVIGAGQQTSPTTAVEPNIVQPTAGAAGSAPQPASTGPTPADIKAAKKRLGL